MILHHDFVKSAKKFAKKLAIVDKTTGKDVPYEKALIASLILSKKFQSLDEGYVGVMIPTGAGAFLTCIGLLMSGRIPVMINYSTGAAENCEYAQDKIGFTPIVTAKALLDKINCRKVDGMVMIEDIMKGISTGDKLKAALKSKMPAKSIIKGFPKCDENDDVVILFTSGSEKEPKAVQLTHHNVGMNAYDAVKVFDLSDKDVMMSMLPVFHSFGQMVNFWLPLLTGMTAVTYANPLDYKTIPKLAREYKCTMMASTPIFIAGYLKESKPGDFENMRIIIAGADKVPDWLREGFMEKHGKVLLEGYGVTECSPVISANTTDENRAGSIGKVFPNIEVKIVGLQKGKELARGDEGKIIVKGEYVMKGYYEDVEETSLRLKDGWYDTGDMGMMDKDDYLWHRGRLKRFVKIGGEMVSLVRTESVLEDILPHGVSCCVVDVPDPRKGAKLAAAVTQKVNDREIIKKLGEKLPPIAVPNQFIVFDELPKMGSGKMNFRAITDMVRTKLGVK